MKPSPSPGRPSRRPWRFLSLLFAAGPAFFPFPPGGSGRAVPELHGPDPQAPRRWAQAALVRADALLAGLPESPADGWGAPGRWSLELERLWALYHLAVEEKGHLPMLEGALARLTPRAPTEDREFLAGFSGAYHVLQAKYARWPPTRLERLKVGFAALDQAVARAPGDPRVRYLRLVSGYHLPAFLGRKAEVEDDFRALFTLLPEGGGAFPPGLFPLVVGFVLEKGSPPETVRQILVGALEGVW